MCFLRIFEKIVVFIENRQKEAQAKQAAAILDKLREHDRREEEKVKLMKDPSKFRLMKACERL